jgi:hypothetical protein
MLFSARRLKYLYHAYLSQPKADRAVYRAIRRAKVHSIVEMGIGNGRRAERMIALAQAWWPEQRLRYTAIDPFELRGDQDSPGLPLKSAYRKFRATGARVQVVPGDPYTALARVANALTGTDLLLISADQDEASLAAAWFYVPRMLHAKSQVLFEEVDDTGMRWRAVSRQQIDKLAARQAQRMRLAA